MAFKTDIEIAQETVMEPITEIAKTAGCGLFRFKGGAVV